MIDNLKILRGDEHTSIKVHDYRAIKQILESYTIKINETIETGFAFAGSAITIMNCTNAKHTAIDPFADSAYKGLGMVNVKALANYPEDLTLIKESSEFVLPRFLQEKRRFDFAFIDANHSFEYAFMEFFYLAKMLTVDGYLVFHDKWMDSIKKVAQYIRKNRNDFQDITPNTVDFQNLFVFKKIKSEHYLPWDVMHAF